MKQIWHRPMAKFKSTIKREAKGEQEKGQSG